MKIRHRKQLKTPTDRRPYKSWGLFVNGKFYGKTCLLHSQATPTIFDFLNGSAFDPIQRSTAVTLEVKEVNVTAK